jgi:thioredoxin 1
MILTDANFEKEINATDKFVLVDFFAVWCDPCSILAPILEKAEKDFNGKFILAKVNVDNAPLTAQKFGIDSIPNVILFKGGKQVGGFVGMRPEQTVKEWLEKMLKENDNKEKIDELEKKYAEYAKANGFQLNPDKEVARRVINGLLENEKKHGQKYCPCRRVTGDTNEDSKKICPCSWHKDEIAKDGHCLCRLYTKI